MIKKIFSLTLLLFLSMSFISAEWTSDLNNGLIGYWGMNEGSGTNVAEEVYGINNLTIQGNVGWKSGIIEDSTGDYSSVGDVTKLSNSSAYNFNINNSFSVSFWMNKTSIQNDELYIGKGESAGRGWYIIKDNLGFKVLFIDSWNSNWFATWFPNSVFVSDGSAWQNYLVTYNGSGNSEGINLYVNGTLIQYSTVSSAGTVNDISNSDSLIVGGWLYSGIYNYQMNGQMDEIGIWNRVLNNSEIQQLYNNGNGSGYNLIIPPNITGFQNVNISQNLTVGDTGFFMSLGSSISRIVNSWFNQVDISGNVSITSNLNIGYERINNTCSGTSCTVSCSSGKQILSGGCNAQYNILNANYPLDNQWVCNTAYPSTINAYVICARIF